MLLLLLLVVPASSSEVVLRPLYSLKQGLAATTLLSAALLLLLLHHHLLDHELLLFQHRKELHRRGLLSLHHPVVVHGTHRLGTRRTTSHACSYSVGDSCSAVILHPGLPTSAHSRTGRRASADSFVALAANSMEDGIGVSI